MAARIAAWWGQQRALPLVVAAAATAAASVRLWTCDDAFISFRYAANLLDGHGLVFNAGERVEGMTNALWTLWIAVGMALGVAPEGWAAAFGLCAFAAVVWLLGRRGNLRQPPLAALCAAAAAPLQVWATGGLETMANVALVVLGWSLAFPGTGPDDTTPSPRRAVAAGAIMALASMTRPDSVLLAACFGAVLLLGAGRNAARDRVRPALGFAAGFAALWLPFVAWRWAYYGDLVPNTYYAKSADLWWLEQGAVYVGLAWRGLPALALGPMLALLLLVGDRVPRWQRPRLWSAVVATGAFTAGIAKFGGDFMHLRMLLPVAPLALVALEASLWALLPTVQGAPRRAWALAATLALATALWPTPLAPGEQVWGVADERSFYDAERSARLEQDAQQAAYFLRGLPVRVAFIGGQARWVYRSGVPVAVEAETGLTDAFVARQPLRRRGRVGHEKHAPPAYLVEARRLHLVLGGFAFRYLGLDGYIPRVPVRMGGVTAYLLRWDPALVAALRARGAKIPAFAERAAAIVADPTLVPEGERAAVLAQLRRFGL